MFSTLQLHDLDQVNYQDFSATSYSALHDSQLPPATTMIPATVNSQNPVGLL
jgi:hypothetical protein